MDVHSPETLGRLSLRLDVYSPPQVLQIHGRLCHLVLAFLIIGEATNSRAPLLHGHCSASSLIRTPPPPSRLRSISRLSRLYDLPCSGDFAPGRGGLLQLLGVSLPPCCRFHPAEVKVPHRSDFGAPCCLRPTVAGSALGFTHFRGHICVHCCYGPVARDLPQGDLVDRLKSFGFPPPCYPNYGASDSCPGRFTPADQTGARVDCFSVRAASPKWPEGRHPHCHFRGLLRLHSRYGPPDRSAAQGDLCHKAPAPPVTQPSRSSATRSIDNSLGGIYLH